MTSTVTGPATGLATRRYRLRADALYVRSGDGVVLYNDTGSMTMRGNGGYELIASLFRRLDGHRTLGELYPRLSPGMSTALLRVTEALARNGFLVDVPDEPDAVPEWAATRFAEQLAFLGRFPGCPMRRLGAVRSRSVLVTGDGPPLRAVAGALADVGFAHVLIAPAGPVPLGDIVEHVRERDPDATWTVLPAGAEEPATDAVIHATDCRAHDSLLSWQDAALAGGRLFGALAPVTDLLLAAVVEPAADWCWDCLRRSVLGQPDDGEPSPGTASSLAAFHVAHQLFCRFADITPESRFATVDRHTLSTSAHRPWRHPLCPRHAAMPLPTGRDVDVIRRDVPDPASAALDGVHDEIVAATRSWVDRTTGPLVSAGEDELSQLPLAASRCVVRTAASTPESPRTAAVVCRGVSARETRNQVVLSALAWLAGCTGEHLGAGWSLAEARYRALAAASLSLPSSGPVSRRTVSLDGRPVRDFLLAALPGVEAAVRPVATGFLLAEIFLAGECAGRAVGLTEENAVDNALVAALAGRAGDTADVVTTALLMPPAESWAAALEILSARADEYLPCRAVTERVPFAAGLAWVVVVGEA